MKKEDIKLISHVVSAFVTFIGVGGAFAYYLKVIGNLSVLDLFFPLLIYILAVLLLIYFLIQKIQREDSNEG
jgi:uncharacterized membrane protein